MRLILIIVITFLFSCAHVDDYRRKTWDEERWGEIVQQQLDNSCGFASILTIMIHHYGDDRYDEKKLIEYYTEKASEEDLARAMKDGLSMLELENLVLDLGYETKKYNLTIDQLEEIVSIVPVLVYLEIGDYKHFAVVRGINGDVVWLADPSRGNVYHTKNDFLKEWRVPDVVKDVVLPGGFIILSRNAYPKLNLLGDPITGLPESLIQLKRSQIFKNGL